MANNNGPGIDPLQRAADSAQREALDSLNRANREKDRVSRQSTADVLKEVEDVSKTSGSWVETRGF